MAVPVFPPGGGGGGGGSLPSGTGIVKVTGGVGGLAVEGVDFDVPLTDAALALYDAQAKLGAPPAGKRWIVYDTPLANSSGSGWSNSGSTSGATATAETNADGAVIDVSTSATASKLSIVHPGGAVSYVANARTSNWYCRWRAKIATALDSQANACVELRPAAAVATLPAIQFGALPNTSPNDATHIAWAIYAAGGLTASGATSTAWDNSYHTWVVYNDGTNVHFNYDGVDLATHASSAVDTSSAMVIAAETYNGTTAAARILSVTSMVFVGYGN